MGLTRQFVIAAVIMAGAACGPKGAEKPAPMPEWICSGRTTERSVQIRIEAKTREEALEKLKQQYPDIGRPGCSLNPRR
jgi:hypothetical protein